MSAGDHQPDRDDTGEGFGVCAEALARQVLWRGEREDWRALGPSAARMDRTASRSSGVFLPRAGRLADTVHARLAGITPASAHPVDAVLASVRTAQTVTGSARTALAGSTVVDAALRRAGLTDRVAERPAGARLAGQALTAIAVIRADAGETGLARGTGTHAGSTHAAGKTLSVVAGALADSGHAGLAQGRIAGTAASVHTRLAGAASGLAGPADAIVAGPTLDSTGSGHAGLARARVAIQRVIVDDTVAVIVHSVANLGWFSCGGTVDLVEHGARGCRVDPDSAIGHAERGVSATQGLHVRRSEDLEGWLATRPLQSHIERAGSMLHHQHDLRRRVLGNRREGLDGEDQERQADRPLPQGSVQGVHVPSRLRNDRSWTGFSGP